MIKTRTRTVKRKNQLKTIQSKPLQREAFFNRDFINEENRTVELAFSSEEPVERGFGIEILDHASTSIRLGRLENGAPVLVDHDRRDHVGVIESVSIDKDRRGRAVVRFGRSERATEIFNDVVDGIRSKVSVGYRIFNGVLEEQSDEKGDTYRINDWEPYEITVTSIGADDSVGVNRSLDSDENNELIISEVRTMPDPQTAPAENKPAEVDTKAIRSAGITEGGNQERSRVNEILTIGEKYGMGDLARTFVNDGKSVDAMREAALERFGGAAPVEAEAPEIGLSEREMEQFSFVRAMNALANPRDHKAQESASFEIECSRAAGERMKKDVQGIMVPADILKRSLVDMKRDLNVATATAGGNVVSTDLLSASFIELLRNKAMMMQPGMATLMTDLNGNLAIPRQSGGATSYWVAESGAPAESEATFDQVTLSPNTIGAFTDFSRKLLLQSSIDVEAFVRGDLARTLALGIDAAAINGDGTGNQPVGILNTTGIGDVAGGANGLAAAWSHIVDLETAVAIDNADIGSLRYLTNAKVRGKLKQTEKAASTAQFIMAEGGELNGYEAMITNQVPSNLVKGASGAVCSASIFGNFADLLIGMWGGLDLTVDPYSNSTSGTVRVVALQDIDLAVRHAESFAAMQDILT